jgi:pterin-4a-carbinolamine dehydratase
LRGIGAAPSAATLEGRLIDLRRQRELCRQPAEEDHRIERSFRFRNFPEALTFLLDIRELTRI